VDDGKQNKLTSTEIALIETLRRDKDGAYLTQELAVAVQSGSGFIVVPRWVIRMLCWFGIATFVITACVALWFFVKYL
jgi:hypothetical protein